MIDSNLRFRIGLKVCGIAAIALASKLYTGRNSK